MGFLDVIDREVEWLTTEPLAGFPSLLKTSTSVDGVFDYIGGRTKRLQQNPSQIHVYRERFTERRESNANKYQLNAMVAAVLWPMALNAEQADVDQELMDQALDRLLTRVRGEPDHTHGNRFWMAGEDGGIPGAGSIDIELPDWRTGIGLVDAPLGAGKAYVVEVKYPIIEYLVG